jgi:uroporphyrinogen decarboxylase
VKDAGKLNMLHVHGEDIMFDLMTSLPADMVNWHDRVTYPTLKEAKALFSGLPVGGIDDRKLIVDGPVDAIRAQAQDALDQTGGRRVLVGPGCVIPTNTPDAHVRAVIDVVRGGK